MNAKHKKMKFKSVILIVMGILIFSCSDDTNEGSLSIKATAKYSNTKAKSNAANVVLSKFLINIREIELEYDDLEDTNENSDIENLYDDVEFDGPFELDLLSGPTQIDVASANVPFDTFEEIEFNMSPSQDSTSELFEKSIKIEGTIDGTSFVFWHSIDEEFEVDYSNSANDIVVTGNGESITINFDLDIVFGSASGIDFSTATDGNNDGLIEIYPGDPDGNSAIADEIKNLIHEGADLLDD